MAEIDAHLSSAIYFVVIPGFILYIIINYVFGFRKAKLEAFILNVMCGWVHRKFFHREKQLLFEQMKDLRNKSKSDLLVLEIGAGSGMNFQFYPKGTKVTALDPNPYHEAYLTANLEKSENNVQLVGFVKNFAENMSSVENHSFDAVVCTLTLCTVQDPAAVLAEVKRVLKSGGTFFYLEHVAGHRGSFVRCAQNILQCIWPYFSGGCNINRETWVFLDQSGFSNVQYRHYSANTWLAFFGRPCLYGTAVK